MSQNAANARKKGAERWATFLLDNGINDKESVTEVLQHLAEAHHKRVAPVWDSNEHSIAWRNYFVAALQKVLRELPSQRTSTEDLHEEIERLKVPVEATAAALPKNEDDTNDDAGKNPTEEASQPPDTFTTSTDTSTTSTETITSTSTSPRRLLSTTTTTAETGIKIDTQGECRARIIEDGTIEFRLSGPATVTYRPSVTTSTTSGAGTGTAAVIAAAVAAAAAARGIPFVPEGQVHETTTTTEETVEELVGTSSGSDASDGTSTVRDTPSGSDASDDTSTVHVRDTPSEDTSSDSGSGSSDQTQVHTSEITPGTATSGTAAAQARLPSGTTGTATTSDNSVVHGTPSDMESQTQTHTSGTATPGAAIARGTPSQSQAQDHTSETPSASARGTPSGTAAVRGTGNTSHVQSQAQVHTSGTATLGTAAARSSGIGTPSETAAVLRGTGTWAEVDIHIADMMERQRWKASSSILRQAMLYNLSSARLEELPFQGNVDATTSRSVPQTQVNIGASGPSVSAASGAGTGTTSVSEALVLPLRAGPASAAAGGTGTCTSIPSVALEQADGNTSGTAGSMFAAGATNTSSVAADEGQNWDPFAALVEAAAAAPRLATGAGGNAPADEHDRHDGRDLNGPE
ncbi:hypothetical protein QBC32DRAFT_222587 [Pseudoneurospora amorphoporcata]|uniref:Uncharacterized protein n=1 Tax=Pseudoneurospora amorphoporcata TaxID=241081 RepID=A0AAN6NQV7_9PEZI|nr:hypothetical protein QBC32DRAFT_222587 [Pseudoneurospora amorphoporcata]